MHALKPARKLATQSLGGWVYVATHRDRSDGSQTHVLTYRSRSGEFGWQSSAIADRENADCAAATLADFLGAQVRF
jgi:hypothetical protein